MAYFIMWLLWFLTSVGLNFKAYGGSIKRHLEGRQVNVATCSRCPAWATTQTKMTTICNNGEMTLNLTFIFKLSPEQKVLLGARNK